MKKQILFVALIATSGYVTSAWKGQVKSTSSSSTPADVPVTKPASGTTAATQLTAAQALNGNNPADVIAGALNQAGISIADIQAATASDAGYIAGQRYINPSASTAGAATNSKKLGRLGRK